MFFDDLTALSRLRVGGAEIVQKIDFEATIAALMRDKCYSPEAVNGITMESLARLVTAYLLRRNGVLPRLLRRRLVASPNIKIYHGTPEQNVQIDRTLAMMSHRSFFGDGAASELSAIALRNSLFDPEPIIDTRIAIVGIGAAGIILRAALAQVGFHYITVYERRSNSLGIWSERSVHSGSRNNPRALSILRQNLHAAPGDGNHVATVLNDIHYQSRQYISSYPRLNEPVIRIVPGDLEHRVVTASGTKEYPIVINASGMGLPKPISDPTRMIGPKHHVRAIRWQYPQLATEKKKKKQRYVFVGLGNSTAEMLHVVQQMKNCDYRVLTHYPHEAIANPSRTVQSRGTSFRMFRDLSVPNLTSYQGDLIHSRQAYYRALLEGKIISDVEEWDVSKAAENRKLSVRCHGENELREVFEFNDIYVLTGYRHTAASFDSMGVCYDENLTPRYDYDGEFQTDPYREYVGDKNENRLFKGYFGFGGVLNAPHNRNSVVIPGMIFRAPDLLFGVIMRSLEYQQRIGRLKAKV